MIAVPILCLALGVQRPETRHQVKQFLAELVAEHHSAHYNTSDYSNATTTKCLAEGTVLQEA